MGLAARRGDLALIPQGRPGAGLLEKVTPEYMLVKVVAAPRGRANKFKLLNGKSFVRDYPAIIKFYILPEEKFSVPVDTILAEVPSIYDNLDEARAILKKYRNDKEALEWKPEGTET